jgi:ABC-type multidrug transport system fused ATPase/permease subunit
LEEKISKMNQLPSPNDDPSGFAVMVAGGIPRLTSEWPGKGQIVLRNLKMRYRPETPLVLKGLNVFISAGERVGVVGRTGSGKSSLLLSLLRLVEPALEKDAIEKYEAPIEIDGIDVLRIGLRDLRSRVGIIPQNPVLFSGTIRLNGKFVQNACVLFVYVNHVTDLFIGTVDPFNDYNDEQIWDALKKCNMSDVVDEMGGLESLVSEYGENLSSGQRQMLVLGRALLRQNKILLLDEATSNVGKSLRRLRASSEFIF